MNAKISRARFGGYLVAAGTVVLAAKILLADDATRSDLEARVDRVADELAVQRVLYDYGYHLDNGDWASYASLFGETGRWEGGLGAAIGPEAIEKMLTESLGPPREHSEMHRTMHLMTNPRIDVDENGVTATSVSKYTFVVTGTDGEPELRIHAHYTDRLVEEADGWKIMERKVQHDIFRPNPMSDL